MDGAERRHEAVVYYVDVSHEDLFPFDSTTPCCKSVDVIFNCELDFCYRDRLSTCEC
jgi:hypothetical protein